MITILFVTLSPLTFIHFLFARFNYFDAADYVNKFSSFLLSAQVYVRGSDSVEIVKHRLHGSDARASAKASDAVLLLEPCNLSFLVLSFSFTVCVCVFMSWGSNVTIGKGIYDRLDLVGKFGWLENLFVC